MPEPFIATGLMEGDLIVTVADLPLPAHAVAEELTAVLEQESERTNKGVQVGFWRRAHYEPLPGVHHTIAHAVDIADENL